MDEGYNPAYGARPLRRAIMRLLEDSMAERMLGGDIKEGDSVIIDGERLARCPSILSPTHPIPAPRLADAAAAVDADGQISVLNGDKKMVSSVPAATGIDYSG